MTVAKILGMFQFAVGVSLPSMFFGEQNRLLYDPAGVLLISASTIDSVLL